MAIEANASRDDGNAPDISQYLLTEASGPVPSPEDEFQPGPVLQDVHKALVERIADVDDDRRRSSVALRKAFNAHRTQVQARLKHQQLMLGVLLGVPLLLLAVAVVGLAWFAWDWAQRQDTRLAVLEAELAAVRSGGAAADASGLAGQWAQLQQAAEQLAEELADLRNGAVTPEQVASQIGGQLAPLRERLAALEEQRAAAPAAPPLDPLFEQRLAALEQAHRRLLRELSAPAPFAPRPALAPAGEALRQPADESAPGPVEPAEVAAPWETAGPAAEPGTDAEATDEPPAVTAAQSEPREGPAPQAPVIRVGARGYALQLIGFHDRAALQAFIARHALPAQVFSREEQFRGRPWYVLIHSLHPDLASASAAQAALPPDLAGLDVWIRALPAEAELQVIETAQ